MRLLKTAGKLPLVRLLAGAAVLLLCPVLLLAQTRMIHGTVLDESGKPLVGASVVVKNKSGGSATNETGAFSINATTGNVLVISAVNYEPVEVRVGTDNNINISLKPQAGSLSDVVVVGYGTQKKAHMTSAVNVVDGSQLVNRPSTNALAALQGVTPGLVLTRSNGQPGKEGWDMTLRGISSINGSNSPLVIVDGVPGTISTLNPNDIESISVLKDAAAAAIYGSEAANGVIVVTTKTGKSGKVKIDYSGIYTFNKPYNMPERNPSWIEADMLNKARLNAGQGASWSADQIRWMQSPDTNYLPNPTNPGAWDFYENIDYIDMLFRDVTRSQQHNLSVSGKTGKSGYLFSLGYYDQNGIFKMGPDDHKRINARINLNTQFNDYISLSSRVAYTRSSTLSPGGSANGDYGLIYGLYQTRTLYPVFLPKNDGSTAGSYDETKYAQGGSTTYAILNEGGYTDESSNRLEGAFTLKVDKLVKGFSVRAIYSPRYIESSNDNFRRYIPFYNKNGTIGGQANNPNSISKNRATTFYNNFQLLGDYDYQLGDHGFHLLAGYQYDDYNYNYVSSTASNLISNELPSLTWPANPAINTPGVGDNIQGWARVSYFGELTYNFDSRYLLKGSLRRDASSILAPGYRTKWYPGVSLGWNMHSEKWFENLVPFVQQLKLRASWGRLGNSNSSNFGNYDYIALLNKGGTYPFNNVLNNSVYQAAYASELKSWETLESYNLGMDIALFKNRFTGSFNYFTRNNIDMLVTPAVPAIFGLTAAQRNDAAMKSWGWEVEVGWKEKINKNLSYFVNANIADAKNKITDLKGNKVYSAGVRGTIEGLPVNTIWGYKTAGYFQTAAEVAGHAKQDNRVGAGDIKYVDQNKDGFINGGRNTEADHGDLVNLGETTPHYTFGFNFGFEYKGFDFSAFFQGVGQRKMLIYSLAALPYGESWRQAWKINNDYWTPENPNAMFPRLYLGGTHNTVVSDFWVQDAWYVRLKNVQLGYTLPEKLTQKAGISKLRVYFTGQDLWEKTGMWYKYYDPEQPNNSSFDYPFFRSYAAGLNITF
ncbi:TonB-dependent receptor [Paraflavitalea speifideaquila]|uniref:SusC/RagA family TonB-linked outer membrane protein n=1 Tax=Paraflavitalea speifideaquila TaxID=3076558 RepID=UPI0028EF2BAF|nr:TonB-dependent receptor [Paraflavitalea speifideiaquila]